MSGKIEFIDLKTQQHRIKDRLDAAIQKVLAHGNYIMGPEVEELERQLCAFSGARRLGKLRGNDHGIRVPQEVVPHRPRAAPAQQAPATTALA